MIETVQQDIESQLSSLPDYRQSFPSVKYLLKQKVDLTNDHMGVSAGLCNMNLRKLRHLRLVMYIFPVIKEWKWWKRVLGFKELAPLEAPVALGVLKPVGSPLLPLPLLQGHG